jgi:hypothetical protein
VEVDIFSPLRFSIQEVKNLLSVFAISFGRRHPIICVPHYSLYPKQLKHISQDICISTWQDTIFYMMPNLVFCRDLKDPVVMHSSSPGI